MSCTAFWTLYFTCAKLQQKPNTPPLIIYWIAVKGPRNTVLVRPYTYPDIFRLSHADVLYVLIHVGHRTITAPRLFPNRPQSSVTFPVHPGPYDFRLSSDRCPGYVSISTQPRGCCGSTCSVNYSSIGQMWACTCKVSVIIDTNHKQINTAGSMWAYTRYKSLDSCIQKSVPYWLMYRSVQTVHECTAIEGTYLTWFVSNKFKVNQTGYWHACPLHVCTEG